MPAAIETYKIRVAIKLDNGTTTSGEKKTVSVSFPSINEKAFDADKALAITTALSPVFSKSVYYTNKTEESSITDE